MFLPCGILQSEDKSHDVAVGPSLGRHRHGTESLAESGEQVNAEKLIENCTDYARALVYQYIVLL